MSLDWSQIGPHGYRGHWIIYQKNLELALDHRIEELDNVEVHMDHEVVEIDQDADGVVVRYRNRKDGAERTVRAKYAVAADGANSFVREQPGITTTEGTFGPLQLVIDTVPSADIAASIVGAGHPGNVEIVLVAGKPAKWNGRLTHPDLERIRAQAEESRDRLLATPLVEG